MDVKEFFGDENLPAKYSERVIEGEVIEDEAWRVFSRAEDVVLDRLRGVARKKEKYILYDRFEGLGVENNTSYYCYIRAILF